jgi:hypothetical protein
MLDRIPQISSAPIEVVVNDAQPLRIVHGFGRQIIGGLVLWQTTPVAFSIQDPAADTANEIVLIPNASATVRLVLF